jgi:hypothetical protein
VRRIKIAENGSPEPRDRLFFSYNYFNDVAAGFGDVSRYLLGIERTFLHGAMSWEIRLPMAGTVSGDQSLTAGRVDRNYELGNALVGVKAILWETATTLYAAGMAVGLPTADDSRLVRGTDPILVIDNRAVQLVPYGAMIWQPLERWFLQGFLQVDVAANGNPVAGDATGQSLPQIGKFQDTPLLFADVAASYLLYDCPADCGLTRIVPSAELHYSTTLRDADVVTSSGLFLTDISRRYDVLNMTLGMHFSYANGLVVSPAMCLPLREDDDEQFDYEAQLQLNWYF